MANLPGFKSTIAVGKLTSADLHAALVTRTKFQRATRGVFRQSQNPFLDPSGANAAPDFASLGRFGNDFEAELLGVTEGVIEQALLSCMGSVATAQQAATAAYKHTYTFAETVPATGGYLSAERGYGNGSLAQAANVAVRRVEARGGNDGILRFGIQGPAGKPQKVTKTTPTYSAAPPLPGNYDTILTIAGVAVRLRSGWSWFADHNNDEDGYDATTTPGGRFRKNADYGEQAAGFEGTALFEDMDMLRRFWASAAANNPDDVGDAPLYACSILTDGKNIESTYNHSVKWVADKVLLEVSPEPEMTRGGLRQRIRGTALRDASTGVAKVELINTSTSI